MSLAELQRALLGYPWLVLIMAAVFGAAGAARADYESFKTWKSLDDALNYNWKLASWRWFRGAVTAAVGFAAAHPVLAALVPQGGLS